LQKLLTLHVDNFLLTCCCNSHSLSTYLQGQKQTMMSKFKIAGDLLRGDKVEWNETKSKRKILDVRKVSENTTEVLLSKGDRFTIPSDTAVYTF